MFCQTRQWLSCIHLSDLVKKTSPFVHVTASTAETRDEGPKDDGNEDNYLCRWGKVKGGILRYENANKKKAGPEDMYGDSEKERKLWSALQKMNESRAICCPDCVGGFNLAVVSGLQLSRHVGVAWHVKPHWRFDVRPPKSKWPELIPQPSEVSRCLYTTASGDHKVPCRLASAVCFLTFCNFFSRPAFWLLRVQASPSRPELIVQVFIWAPEVWEHKLESLWGAENAMVTTNFHHYRNY